MTRRMHTTTAAMGIACVLLLAGCQGEDPDPAPTAVLPTPEVPGPPDPSTTGPSEAQAINDAAERYVEGREQAEAMLVAGEYDDVEERLSPYFSGSYLAYWEAEFGEFEREGWTTTGAVKFTVVDADRYERSTDSEQSVSIYACVDFREATTLNEKGSQIQRGYDFSLDRVDMVMTSGTWKADEIDSVPIDEPISETPCADPFA